MKRISALVITLVVLFTLISGVDQASSQALQRSRPGRGARRPKKEKAPLTGRTRALVIHRDPEMRRRIEEGLAEKGWEIHLAEGRRDGMSLLYRVQPELIFLEITGELEASWQMFFDIRLFTDQPIILLAEMLPAPAYRSECAYNAMVFLQPPPISVLIAAAHAIRQVQAPPSSGQKRAHPMEILP